MNFSSVWACRARNWPPPQLSGGQQQRVAITRTLALDPAVVVFDEPTSASDPELVGEVLNVIRVLASQGVIVLVATHGTSFARAVGGHRDLHVRRRGGGTRTTAQGVLGTEARTDPGVPGVGPGTGVQFVSRGMDRRTVLRAAGLGGLGLLSLAACTQPEQPQPTREDGAPFDLSPEQNGRIRSDADPAVRALLPENIAAGGVLTVGGCSTPHHHSRSARPTRSHRSVRRWTPPTSLPTNWGSN